MTTELVTFLEPRCRALELLQNIQSLKTTPTTTRTSQVTGHKVSTPSYSNVATVLHCPLCNGSHRTFKCEKFLRLQAKQSLSQAKRLGLCFNCLQPYTRNHTCSKQVCRLCHKTHHTSIHIDRQNQTTNDKGSTNNNNKTCVRTRAYSKNLKYYNINGIENWRQFFSSYHSATVAQNLQTFHPIVQAKSAWSFLQ